MSQKDNIEQIIREKLEGHQSPLNKDLWKNISSELGHDDLRPPSADKKEGTGRRRKWMLWLLAAGLGVGVWYWSADTNNEDKLSPNTTEQNGDIGQAGAHSEITPTNETSLLSKPDNVSEIASDPSTYSNKSQFSDVLATAESHLAPDTNHGQTSSSHYAAYMRIQVQKSTSNQPAPDSEMNNDFSTHATIAAGSTANSTLAGTVSNGGNTEKFGPSAHVQNADVQAGKTVPDDNRDEWTHQPETKATRRTQGPAKPTEEPVFESVKEENNDSNADEKYRALPEKKYKWRVEALAGPTVNYRTFSSSENRALQEHRNTHDSQMMTYSWGLNLAYRLGDKVDIHLGGMNMRMGEDYDFTGPSAWHSTTNTYDFLSLTTGVDYRFVQMRDIALSAGLGAQMNFMREAQSSWLDPHNHSAQIHDNTGSNSPFSKSTIGLHANIGLSYRLNNQFDLLLRERATLSMNSIYIEATGLDQRPYAFKTLLGVRYAFK